MEGGICGNFLLRGFLLDSFGFVLLVVCVSACLVFCVGHYLLMTCIFSFVLSAFDALDEEFGRGAALVS